MDEMKKLQKKIVCFCILLSTLTFNSVAANWVYIQTKEGNGLYFSLEDNPKVSFGKDNIYIDLKDNQLYFPYTDYVSFRFVDQIQPSDINLCESICKMDGENLYLYNLPSNSPVRFFSLSGVLLESLNASTEGTIICNLSLFRNKIVVVQTVNQSFKIFK